MLLYKFPLSLNPAYPELGFADHAALMRANIGADGVGATGWIKERQPESLRGFMWEAIYDEAKDREVMYYMMLLDEEGAGLLQLGHPSLWKPDELFYNPKWSRTIAAW